MTNVPDPGGSFAGNAPYQCEIEKVLSGEYWVNRYFIMADTLPGAVQQAQSILTIEREIHSQLVTFTKMSVRTTAIEDYIYSTVPINAPGNVSAGAAQLAPLFVVLRVDLGVAAGRPSRKYYRGCLREDQITTFRLEEVSVPFFQTRLDALPSVVGLVDPQGQDIISATVSPLVGMRQLRRGSKKKPIQSPGGAA